MYLAYARLRNQLLQRRLRNAQLSPQAETNLHALAGLTSHAKALSCRYVVVDLETTGLNLARDRILSMGAVRLDQSGIDDEDYFYELVNPQCHISDQSRKIHGIFPEWVKDARCIDEVFEDFLAYLGGDILVAHAARFDLHFLNQAMRASHGFDLQNLVLDTQLMCRHRQAMSSTRPMAIMGGMQGMRLGQLAREMGIRVGDRHTAIGDAVITAEVFQHCVRKYFGGEKCTLGRLIWAAGII